MSNVRGLQDFPADRPNQRYQIVGANNDQADGTTIPLGPPSSFGDNGALLIPKISDYVVPRFSIKSFVFFISVVDVLMFLAELIIGGVQYGGISGVFAKGNGMGGPNAETLHFCGGKLTCPDIHCGQIWRLVTPIILHGGVVHIVSNLFFQLHFGFVFEIRWTTPRFIIIYFLAGIGATLLSAVRSPYTISIGASGALFGILGADVTFLLMNWKGVPRACNEMCILVSTLVLNMVISLDTTGEGKSIDSWAHLGGLISGMLLATFLCPNVIYNQYTKPLKIIGALFALIFFAVLTTLTFLPGYLCPGVTCPAL